VGVFRVTWQKQSVDSWVVPDSREQHLIRHSRFVSSQLLKCGQCIITDLHDVSDCSLQLCAAFQAFDDRIEQTVRFGLNVFAAVPVSQTNHVARK